MPRSDRSTRRWWRAWGGRRTDASTTAKPRTGAVTMTQPPAPLTFDDLIKPRARAASEH